MRFAERNLIALAVVLSLALTAITVWSVASQSQAFQERELTDLRLAARQIVSEKSAALRRDVERLFEAAGWAWTAAGSTGLNLWSAGQRDWPLIFARQARDSSSQGRGGGEWQRYPRGTPPTLPTVVGERPRDPTPEEIREQEQLIAAADAIRAMLPAGPDAENEAEREVVFEATPEGVFPTAVIAVRRIADDADLAIVAPIEAVLRRYWASPDAALRWTLQVGDFGPGVLVLAETGEMFGGARLIASDTMLARLETQSGRRLAFVIAAGAGTACAWCVVIWLMIRLISGQRELVRLQRRIVADVSHELKTPLALIRLLAETLRAQRVRDPSRHDEYLDTIIRESERLTVLLESILDFAKFERGQRPYQFESCEAGAVARQAWTLYEPQFVAEGFDARLEVDPTLPPVRADAQALHQLVVNLLQNAHRYSGDRKYIRLRVRTEGYVLVIEVEDRGIGMTRDQLARLGESFVRGDDPRVRRARGAGLGLAIVNHIVTAHNGKLEVHSRPGEGSRFTVWIPIEGDGASAPPPTNVTRSTVSPIA